MSSIVAALHDWHRAVYAWRYWWKFGLLDISLRYRRTYLGPFWITLSFALTSAGLSFVFTSLFRIETQFYVPYLVTGLSAWMFISGSIIEGCASLTRHSGLIREQNIPFLAHAFRDTASGLLVYLHNLVIVVGVALVFSVPITPWTLLTIPAILVMALNVLWITQFFGLISARYRDLPPLITSLVNLSFLITPVFWFRDQLGGRIMIADANPFFHFIELVRAPMLGNPPSMLTVYVVAGITVGGWAMTLLVAARFHPKLTFWV